MTSAKSGTTKKIVLACVAVLIAAGGVYSFTMYQKGMKRVAAMNADVMPPFEELKPGPRAKSSQAFGIEVGKTSLEDAKKHFAKWGVTCVDTSMRALMQQGRDAKKKEIEEVKAAGGDIDAISGASMVNYRSKKERNPQVRMSCEVTAAGLKDRKRAEPSAPDFEGRLLFVHDSANHPTRHVSFRRMHANHPEAWDDTRATVRAMTKRYGPPTHADTLPEADESGSIRFPRFRKYSFRWEWADLKAEVAATNMGKGVDVNESVEVPWPLRSDAPGLQATALESPPPRIQPPNPLTPDLKALLDEMDARKKAKRAAAKAAKAPPAGAKSNDKKSGSGADFKATGTEAIEKARQRALLRRELARSKKAPAPK